MKAVYLGSFSDKQDVESNFSLPEGQLDKANVLVACYSNECYEGYAFVLFEEDGKLNEVHGSHCSCYGLEGQWEPEDVTLDELKHRVKHGDLGHYLGGNAVSTLAEVEKAIRRVVRRKK